MEDIVPASKGSGGWAVMADSKSAMSDKKRGAYLLLLSYGHMLTRLLSLTYALKACYLLTYMAPIRAVGSTSLDHNLPTS